MSTQQPSAPPLTGGAWQQRGLRQRAAIVFALLLLLALVPTEIATAQEPELDGVFEEPWEEPPLSETGLFSATFASSSCQLLRSDGNYSLSFPLIGAPSTGALTAVVLPVRFSESFEVDLATYVPPFIDATERYLSEESSGRLEVRSEIYDSWIEPSRPHTDYNIGGNNGAISANDFVTEIVGLADPHVDFSSADVIWIVAAPTPDFFLSTAGMPFDLSPDGADIKGEVILTTANDSVMVHEALHNLGLPDLYDTSGLLDDDVLDQPRSRFVGYFDVMSESFDGFGTSPLLRWQAWLLGWIDNSDVYCAPELPSSTSLRSAVSSGDHAMAVYRLDARRVIVAEYRFDLPTGERGLLVYTVDGSVRSGNGPIVVQGEQGQFGYPDGTALLTAGESALVSGVVVAAADGPAGPEVHFLDPCNDAAPTIMMSTNGGDGTGTEGDDIIIGTAGDDVIRGLGGNDVICSGGGDDIIEGGTGDDIIRSGTGDDTVRAGPGNDSIIGGQGDDRLFGRQGDDVIVGGQGNDVIHGNLGRDHLSGNAGDDKMFGYADDDILIGGPGNDRMHGNFGDDHMEGGPGDDRLWGYGDADFIDGGTGNDLLVGNFGDDRLAGGPGSDIIWGSDGEDFLYGSFDRQEAETSGGVDQLHGNSGDDVLVVINPASSMDGGIGTDACYYEGFYGRSHTRCERFN